MININDVAPASFWRASKESPKWVHLFTADAVLEICYEWLIIPVRTEYIRMNSDGFIDNVKSCFLTCEISEKRQADIQLSGVLLLTTPTLMLSQGSSPWARCLNSTGLRSTCMRQKAMEECPDSECNICVSLRQSQKQNIDLTRQAKFASTPAFALFVTLKNVVCKIGEDAEVLMSLYDPVDSKFIR